MEDKPIVRKRSQQNRHRLLKSAQKLFAEKGFHGVSVDEIVNSAAINKRMVYHYFGSKEKLYQEVLTELYHELSQLEIEIYRSSDEPEAIFRTVVFSYFKFLDATPDFVRLLQWENLNEGRAIRGQLDALSKHPALDRLESLIEEGIRSGRFRENINVQHLLIQLIGLCFIYHSNRYTLTRSMGVDLSSPAELKVGMAQVVDLILDGIRAR